MGGRLGSFYTQHGRAGGRTREGGSSAPVASSWLVCKHEHGLLASDIAKPLCAAQLQYQQPATHAPVQKRLVQEKATRRRLPVYAAAQAHQQDVA